MGPGPLATPLAAKRTRITCSEGPEYLQRRVGTVQGVEVDARHPVVEQFIALLRCPLDTHLADRVIVILVAADAALQLRGEVRASGEIGHALHGLDAGDRHDARDQRNVDSLELASFTPVVEGDVVEEHLRGDPVGPLVDLGLEVLQLPQAVGCLRMSFREARDADAETSGVPVGSRFVEGLDVADQIGGMPVFVRSRIVVFIERVIAPERQDVADAGVRISMQDRLDLVVGVLDTGQMGNRIDPIRFVQLNHQIIRPLSGGTSGAVRDRHEGGSEGREVVHPIEQRIQGGIRSRGKELEAERLSISLEDVMNVHRRPLYAMGSGIRPVDSVSAVQCLHRMSDRTSIPRPTIKRLSLYLREIETQEADGAVTVSSRTLGSALGITDAQVRRDLGYFGQFGQPGIGYSVKAMIPRLKSILRIDREWNAAVVGVGNIGRALLNYPRFTAKGFNIVGAFDIDDSIIGTSVGHCRVAPIKEIPRLAVELEIEFGILCVPKVVAQEVADLLVTAGVRGILNFTPQRIEVGPSIDVVSVDFSMALEQLAYQVSEEVHDA